VFGISRDHVLLAMKLGHLPGDKIGVRTLVLRDDLVAWVRSGAFPMQPGVGELAKIATDASVMNVAVGDLSLARSSPPVSLFEKRLDRR
jgi:hypothetical protein